MRYGSVCSGIEAATMAWHGLGWEPAFFSDIEKFPVAVLQHHYPDVPVHGDFTTITEDEYGAIDLLVGGTPCQSFSVAGLRGGMDDERGNLALEFIRLAQRKRPQWLVWENVPGVLSSNGGRDFGSFLGALAEIGYGFAYRVLDAQYFGVAQRRRRVFVVGYLGDWRRAAAVLFERESLSGNPAPSREEGQETAATLTRGFGDRGVDSDQVANGNCAVTYSGVAGALTAKGPTAMGAPEVDGNHYFPVRTFAGNVAVGFQSTANACDAAAAGVNVSPSLRSADPMAVTSNLSVRRLTPTECERLQGFPDGFTQIPWRGKEPENCPDGPRYKALGNSMAVPVMAWIGQRIQAVEAI
jgi:DNA (cytosine-5)-methyltransferase 1